ncbi:curli-like amyloid fiber formation chaperone CsgH [Pseudorhodobacter wandonensis]|jgi:hypothetical protein|uniref:curli-like amyloid fiber formation chaperone CsgH n=1 Tax=Pseudorhodobacter wandonensis TaxID=1120568 RepID=UPI00067D0F5C|nr:curli-like amyloid fiber formation chaperone CsgH [Pseudorhodobacter wandonensis]
MVRAILLILFSAVFSMPAYAQSTPIALPEISIVPKDGMLEISGRVIGLGSGTINATLSIEKSDTAGRLSTSQGREMTVIRGSNEVVSQSSISAQPDLILTVKLTLMNQDAIIGLATTELGHTSK